jgi:hypothetical protein
MVKQIHYGTGGKGAPGERVNLDFYSSFFLLWRGRGVEGNVLFDMWKEERKGMIFFMIFFFHCGVAGDRGELERVFFLIC